MWNVLLVHAPTSAPFSIRTPTAIWVTEECGEVEGGEPVRGLSSHQLGISGDEASRRTGISGDGGIPQILWPDSFAQQLDEVLSAPVGGHRERRETLGIARSSQFRVPVERADGHSDLIALDEGKELIRRHHASR